MSRWLLEVIRMGRIRNESIRGTVKVEHFEDKIREARLRSFGHVGQRMLKMDLP